MARSVPQKRLDSKKKPTGKKVVRARTPIKKLGKKMPQTTGKKVGKRTSSRFFSWLDGVSAFSILIIGLCVVAISIISSLFVDMHQWYASLPVAVADSSRWIFEYALSGIFALVTASIVIVWNIRAPGRAFLIWLFVLAGILHVVWNMFFFALYVLSPAFFISLALCLLLWIIFFLVWHRSRVAAMLLLPYICWSIFIVALNAWSFYF